MLLGTTMNPSPGGFGNYMQRVKVYRLNEDGQWDDKGTGHVSVEYLERSDAVGLVVVDEEDNTTLLVHRISPGDIYHRQGAETIITWNDPEISTDLALSFQESCGCAYIWDQICSVQRQINFPSATELIATHRRALENFVREGPVGQQDDNRFQDGPEDVELPAPELKNLEAIAKTLANAPPFRKEKLAALVLQDGWLPKLFDVFKLCEDLDSVDALQAIFRITKGIILLNDTRLFEVLFREDNILTVVGMLEHDPELPAPQQHRKFLEKDVLFKEVVPISNRDVRAKIHQTYRIGYIKDVILPRALDDGTFGTLYSLMLFNNVEVVSALTNDSSFLHELFWKLKSHPVDADLVGGVRCPPASAPAMSMAAWKDIVLFVQDLCAVAKHLQPAHRGHLFGLLVDNGLRDVITQTLRSTDQAVRLSGTDVLMSLLLQDTASLRQYMLNQKDSEMLTLLVAGLLDGRDDGLEALVLEIVKALLDPESMDVNVERSRFLDLFYDKYMEHVVAALAGGGVAARLEYQPVAPTNAGGGSQKGAGAANGVTLALVSKSVPVGGSSKGGAASSIGGAGASSAAGASTSAPPTPGSEGSPPPVITPPLLMYLLELLCFCVQYHGFRIKYYILRTNVIERVMKALCRRKEQYLVVGAIRFFRTCVGLKDEFYNRYIIKNNIFSIIVDAFIANGARYNLLNSVILELFDFIRKANLKSLIKHVWVTYGAQLEDIVYVDTFLQLKLRYDQMMDADGGADSLAGADASTGANGVLSSKATRRRDGSMDEDEENYFETNSDEEQGGARSTDGSQAWNPAAPASNSSGEELDSGTVAKGQGAAMGSGGATLGGAGRSVGMRLAASANVSLREGKGIGLVDYDDDEEHQEGHHEGGGDAGAHATEVQAQGQVQSQGQAQAQASTHVARPQDGDAPTGVAELNSAPPAGSISLAGLGPGEVKWLPAPALQREGPQGGPGLPSPEEARENGMAWATQGQGVGVGVGVGVGAGAAVPDARPKHAGAALSALELLAGADESTGPVEEVLPKWTDGSAGRAAATHEGALEAREGDGGSTPKEGVDLGGWANGREGGSSPAQPAQPGDGGAYDAAGVAASAPAGEAAGEAAVQAAGEAAHAAADVAAGVAMEEAAGVAAGVAMDMALPSESSVPPESSVVEGSHTTGEEDEAGAPAAKRQKQDEPLTAQGS